MTNLQQTQLSNAMVSVVNSDVLLFTLNILCLPEELGKIAFLGAVKFNIKFAHKYFS